jgi:hypothetical protein
VYTHSRDAPDTDFAGYPAGQISANPKAGYRISGKGLILDNYIFGKISNKFIKTALTITIFCKH